MVLVGSGYKQQAHQAPGIAGDAGSEIQLTANLAA
jgi:hypothetical protein